jgi:hypothetical protein
MGCLTDACNVAMHTLFLPCCCADVVDRRFGGAILPTLFWVGIQEALLWRPAGVAVPM